MSILAMTTRELSELGDRARSQSGEVWVRLPQGLPTGALVPLNASMLVIVYPLAPDVAARDFVRPKTT